MPTRLRSQSRNNTRQLGLKGRPAPAKPQMSGHVPARKRSHGVPLSKRTRGVVRNQRLPFVPPEDWHEPTEAGKGYRIVMQEPGEGFRHVLTPEEVRARLALLPAHLVQSLEVVQFSRMTRKKQSFPCYGMQWGATLYLYPIEQTLIERYDASPSPGQLIEARMFGGTWQPDGQGGWLLCWTEDAIKDFYLNNILIHELGHIIDDRNRRPVDRERYAEWFALEYGYRASRRGQQGWNPRAMRRRHHAGGRRLG